MGAELFERMSRDGTDSGSLSGAYAAAVTAEGLRRAKPKGGCLYIGPISGLLLFFLFDSDAEGFQELHVLIADFEFGIGRQSGNEGSLVGGFFALLADADGSFENQENVVATLLDAGDDFGDLFGIGERLVDGFAEFLHELFELLVHLVPRSPVAWLNMPTGAASTGFGHCSAGGC